MHINRPRGFFTRKLVNSTVDPESTPTVESVIPGRRMIAGLTGIRAIAAGWVVLDHLRVPLFALFPVLRPYLAYFDGGYLGVEIFFVLSGFIIAYNYADRFSVFSRRAYGDFLILRVARIYPVHIATVVVLGILVAAASLGHVTLSAQALFTPANFVANLLMLQAVPPFKAVNYVAWSICVEFAAYLAFPLIARWMTNLRSAATAFVLAAAVAVVGVTAILLVSVADDNPIDYGTIWLRIATEFTIGCLLFAGWRHLGRAQHGRIWDWVAVLSLLGMIGVLALVGGSTSVSLIAVPLIGVFVLSAAGATGLIGRVFSSRLLNWGGRISYSVYMTHAIFIMMAGKLFSWTRFEGAAMPVRLGVAGAYVIGIIVVGAACFYLVEQPGRRLIARLTRRVRPAVTVGL